MPWSILAHCLYRLLRSKELQWHASKAKEKLLIRSQGKNFKIKKDPLGLPHPLDKTFSYNLSIVSVKPGCKAWDRKVTTVFYYRSRCPGTDLYPRTLSSIRPQNRYPGRIATTVYSIYSISSKQFLGYQQVGSFGAETYRVSVHWATSREFFWCGSFTKNSSEQQRFTEWRGTDFKGCQTTKLLCGI